MEITRLCFLSKTQGYFEPTDAESIFGTNIHNASVTMNDGVNEITLNELCSADIPDSLLPLVSQVTGIPEQNLQFFNYCIYTSFRPFGCRSRGKNL